MRQELGCRCKKQGASGNLAAPSRTNPARLHQNVKRSPCYLHAAYGLYLSAADRLVIGDDSQRFHGGTRKLARFLPLLTEHVGSIGRSLKMPMTSPPAPMNPPHCTTSSEKTSGG